jgi:hypothetical protein
MFELQEVVPKCNPGARSGTKSVISSLCSSRVSLVAAKTTAQQLVGGGSYHLLPPKFQPTTTICSTKHIYIFPSNKTCLNLFIFTCEAYPIYSSRNAKLQ